MFGPDGTKRLCDIVTGEKTWIYDIPNKRYNQMWVDKNEPRPMMVRPGFQRRNRFYSIFVNTSGPVAIDILPEKTTLIATYYTKAVLPKVIQSRAWPAPKGRNQQQPPSARQCHSRQGQGHKTVPVQEQDIQVLDRPPYSPDLAPCDFLFLTWRSGWQDGSYPGPLKSRHFRAQRYIPASEYQNAIQMWLRRLKYCVTSGGMYSLVGVWWRCIHWFPFYITCDRTFGLALVDNTQLQRLEHLTQSPDMTKTTHTHDCILDQQSWMAANKLQLNRRRQTLA